MSFTDIFFLKKSWHNQNETLERNLGLSYHANNIHLKYFGNKVFFKVADAFLQV